MQTPQYQVDSLGALQTLPVTAAGVPQSPILGGLADIKRSTSSAVVSQYDIVSMVQIYATPQGRDLGAVAADVKKAIDETAKEVPKGSSVVLLGQVQTMNSAFSGLLFGLLAAIVLIYLLIVVISSPGPIPSSSFPRCRRHLPASCGCCSRPRPRCRCRR